MLSPGCFGFLSTPSARRATGRRRYAGDFRPISIHALREEGDLASCLIASFSFLFLSTPSARRATVSTADKKAPPKFLSTPSARRATGRSFEVALLSGISIHALREEGDAVSFSPPLHPADFYPRPPRGGRRSAHSSNTLPVQFLSTPSARRATDKPSVEELFIQISIHALREEGDQRDFFSHHSAPRFLSTPSARRATSPLYPAPSIRAISIHALREEGDSECWTEARPDQNFYPRPPRGGRLAIFMHNAGSFNISIHALREEGDTCPRPTPTGCRNFYPRPPRGGRPVHQRIVILADAISIHALHEEGDTHDCFG